MDLRPFSSDRHHTWRRRSRVTRGAVERRRCVRDGVQCARRTLVGRSVETDHVHYEAMYMVDSRWDVCRNRPSSIWSCVQGSLSLGGLSKQTKFNMKLYTEQSLVGRSVETDHVHYEVMYTVDSRWEVCRNRSCSIWSYVHGGLLLRGL